MNELHYTLTREELEAQREREELHKKLKEKYIALQRIAIEQQRVNDALIEQLDSYKLYQKNYNLSAELRQLIPEGMAVIEKIEEKDPLLKSLFSKDE